jgi:hypothetical protein
VDVGDFRRDDQRHAGRQLRVAGHAVGFGQQIPHGGVAPDGGGDRLQRVAVLRRVAAAAAVGAGVDGVEILVEIDVVDRALVVGPGAELGLDRTLDDGAQIIIVRRAVVGDEKPEGHTRVTPKPNSFASSPEEQSEGVKFTTFMIARESQRPIPLSGRS